MKKIIPFQLQRLSFGLAIIWGCLTLYGCGKKQFPNVILISIDTLRADHLGSYGYKRNTSPNLDAFAQDGVLFENFVHSGGMTLPSHMSMMTSLFPRVHRINTNSDRILEPFRITLAEQLKSEGLITAAFTDAGWMKGRFGFNQGFDLFDDEGGHFERILPKVYNWLENNHNKNFFLFIHTFDVHSKSKQLPYECPGNYTQRYTAGYNGKFNGCRAGKCASNLFLSIDKAIQAGELNPKEVFTKEELDYIVSLYDGSINYVDDQLDRFFSYLSEIGVYDESLIIVTSDHGEEFLEHGLLLHSQDGYEEIIHIPLIVKFPKSKFKGIRIPHLATMVDLMPTILDILDIALNKQAQGRSLMPAIRVGRTIRDGVHIGNVLRTAQFAYFSVTQEAYDILEDPQESSNLYSTLDDERLAHLQEQLNVYIRLDKEHVSRFKDLDAVDKNRMNLTEKEIQKLHSLGYIR